MEIKKLHESDELLDRAKKHKKNNKGLSFDCTLNPDAGNVEHNVAMFNHMNTPADSPSVNPCGPMAEDVNLRKEKPMDLTELHYDDLEVTIVTRKQKSPSYHFDYDRDEAQTVEETVSYDHYVSTADITDFIAENITENDFADIDSASDREILDFVKNNFDQLFDKYESMILDHYRSTAREAAEREMNESLTPSKLSETTCGTEKFLHKLGNGLHEMYIAKEIDENTATELTKLKSLYEKYARVNDKFHKDRIVEKIRSALASCADDKNLQLNESLSSSHEYVIMAVTTDGKKQYYNVSSAPHWVLNGKMRLELFGSNLIKKRSSEYLFLTTIMKK